MFKLPWDSSQPGGARDEFGDAFAELVELESQRKQSEEVPSIPGRAVETSVEPTASAHEAETNFENRPNSTASSSSSGPLSKGLEDAPKADRDEKERIGQSDSNFTASDVVEKAASDNVDAPIAAARDDAKDKDSQSDRADSKHPTVEKMVTKENIVPVETAKENVASATASTKRKADAIDICIHRRDDGGWIISPLYEDADLELQRTGPENKKPHVIWRLDDRTFDTAQNEHSDSAQLPERKEPGSVAKRLKRTSAELKQLQAAASALQETFQNFQRDKMEFEKEKQKHYQELEKKKAELAETETLLKDKRTKLDADRRALDKDRARFRVDADEAGQFLAAALQTSIFCPSGEVAVPAEAFFVAAQGEFVRSVPSLSEPHRLQMQILKAAPNVELLKAKEAFVEDFRSSSEEVLQRRVEALVQAFMVAQCLDIAQKPSSHKTTLENLANMSSTLAHFANKFGRFPLAFAASSCAVWCAFQLTDSFNSQWADVNSESLVKDLEAAEDLGYLDKQGVSRKAKVLVSYGEGMRRVQRYWSEHGDHRRRFIRFFAKCATGRGTTMPAAVEADLRLLILPHSATPAELAMQLQRVRNLVDVNVAEKRQKTTSKRKVDA